MRGRNQKSPTETPSGRLADCAFARGAHRAQTAKIEAPTRPAVSARSDDIHRTVTGTSSCTLSVTHPLVVHTDRAMTPPILESPARTPANFALKRASVLVYEPSVRGYSAFSNVTVPTGSTDVRSLYGNSSLMWYPSLATRTIS